ncbi:MAG: hypothetical protein LBB72_07695 [Spirochaetaceae bacterium]|jgi:hypothetical protein|nr:hypothetical protein [Spirochaetaceae bacterium]
MTKKAKILLLVFTGFIALTVLPVTAQNQGGGNDSYNDFYYVNVPVEKVFTYRKGYVVLFRQSGLSMGQAYIPYEWFRIDSRKAELLDLPSGRTLPSMSVFYKGGKFYSVRLYVSKNPSHESWGHIPFDVNLDDKFEGVESIDIGKQK